MYVVTYMDTHTFSIRMYLVSCVMNFLSTVELLKYHGCQEYEHLTMITCVHIPRKCKTETFMWISMQCILSCEKCE